MAPVAEIEAALRRLTITPEAEALGLVGVCAHALAGMDARKAVDASGKLLLDAGKPPPNFRPANEQTVRTRLRNLDKRAERAASQIERGGKSEKACQLLADEIKYLPGDAVDVLSNVGAISLEENAFRFDVGSIRTRFVVDLKAGRCSVDAIRLIVVMAQRALEQKALADEDQPDRKLGIMPNRHAHAVARVALGAYRKLTGESSAGVARKQEELFELVRTLFDVLHVEGIGRRADDAATAYEYYASQAMLNSSDNSNQKSGA